MFLIKNLVQVFTNDDINSFQSASNWRLTLLSSGVVHTDSSRMVKLIALDKIKQIIFDSQRQMGVKEKPAKN